MVEISLIVGAVFVVAANIGAIWFGGKLAQYRERMGVSAEEDLN